MLLTKWHSCIVPCLPWFEPGPFSNVLEACHIPLYINYGSWRLVLEDCEMIESVRKSEGIRSFLDECRDAGLSSGILILKSLYRVCPNLIPRQGCAAPVFRDKSHFNCFSRWAIDAFSMGAIVGPFVLNTMEDRTIVCTEEEISAAGEERGKGKNRMLLLLSCIWQHKYLAHNKLKDRTVKPPR